MRKFWLVGVIGGLIYCAGGVSDLLGESNRTYVYDPELDVWFPRADMPRTLANPIRLSFAEQKVAKPAPALGQHTDEILRKSLKKSDAEIAKLKADGVV